MEIVTKYRNLARWRVLSDNKPWHTHFLILPKHNYYPLIRLMRHVELKSCFWAVNIFSVLLSFTNKISIDRDNYSVTRLAQKTPADEINAFCWGNSPVYSRPCMIAGRLQLLQRKALSSAHLELRSAWNSDMLIFYWCTAAHEEEREEFKDDFQSPSSPAWHKIDISDRPAAHQVNENGRRGGMCEFLWSSQQSFMLNYVHLY